MEARLSVTDPRRYQKAWRQRNPEKVKASQRRHKLRKTYGISEVDVERMLQQQGGRCAICLVDFSAEVKPYVDHEHSSKTVRGLLCIKCNSGIGLLCEDTVTMLRAINYVSRGKLSVSLVANGGLMEGWDD